MKNIKSEQGQLSIFLGISLMVVITMLAFIINVGLFVKAKINLQNAVDAAAWSGAAVQARQLSNIAHLNWEMRNTYKEWMFKYYVLGQLAITKTSIVPGQWKQGGVARAMSFKMDSFKNNPAPGDRALDPVNIPVICIHFGARNNICEIYDIPGIPRFETVGLPGIAEHHETTLRAIVRRKSADCSFRTDLNFATAITWAYGTGKPPFAEAPKIAATRTGAWPQAIELGMRIRNLEMIVNRPAVSNICSGGGNCQDVSNLNYDGISSQIGLNERPIKAFMSAWRNLGGGEFDQSQSSFKKSFKLTEISPNPFHPGENSLSTFLIPAAATVGGGGVSVRTKTYLDLQVLPLNLVTFFTAFVVNTAREGGLRSRGACLGTKTGLPVPAYLMGFVKNPEVLTYYAVKGEANFIGLFFPFINKRKGITLQAYAAAKPYGGRIGPRLFSIRNNQSINPKSSGLSFSSASGLSLGFSGFKKGYPIPTVSSFWASNITDVIGGIPNAGVTPKFAIPNMIYDIVGDISNMGEHIGSASPLLIVRPNLILRSHEVEEDPAGLYDVNQFRSFSESNLTADELRDDLTAREIEQALNRVRRPTRYEALNYMIPTETNNTYALTDALGVVNKDSAGKYRLFAPLFGAGTLYGSAEEVKNIITDFIQQNVSAIDTFMDTLKDVHDSIINSGRGGGSELAAEDREDYREAAETIYIEPSLDTNCKSLAGRFYQFFRGTGIRCNIVPLDQDISNFISTRNNEEDGFNKFYYAPYPGIIGDPKPFMTAYMPGPRQGAQDSGEILHPFTQESMGFAKRNFYSTKFIALEKVTDVGNQGQSYFTRGVYRESDGNVQNTLRNMPSDIQMSFRNSINKDDQLAEFGVLDH